MRFAAHSRRRRQRNRLPWPASRPLRAWQEVAASQVFAHEGQTFLASATPAAGKTTFGLHIAHQMLADGRISRVAIVAPTTHVCRQWALDAAQYGIDIEPNRSNAEGIEPVDCDGVGLTYQTVAAGSAVHRRATRRGPTLLIADEPHHMGEHAAWGQNMLGAFSDAEFRLLLSGTPFRSDNTAIPWVSYDEDGVSQADFTYGYTEALLDHVCRPVTFHTFDGDMEWMSDGRRRRADFSVVLPQQDCARRLRTALDPDGDWVTTVLQEADERLDRIRAGSHPDGGGLVVAVDKEHAERLAQRLGQITGRRPLVVTSDVSDASNQIARFAAGTDKWLVSVLMVSEGVDIPRLRVGVYATTARTELFFRQVVGRFVRRTATPKSQMSHLFMPADLRLKQLAAVIEEERNHAIDRSPEGELQPRDVLPREQEENNFRPIWSSAHRENEILRTTEPGEPVPLFEFPGAPSKGPQAVASVHSQQYQQGTAVETDNLEPTHARRARLRAERQALVATIARSSGESHSVIHGRVNRETGVTSVSSATVEQLEAGNKLLKKMA